MPSDTGTSGLALLYDTHRAELLRFLRSRCGDESEAQDFLHELWIKLDSLQAGPIANGRAYLFRMANNLVLDQRRARMRGMKRDRAWLGAEDGPVEERRDPAPSAEQELEQSQESQILLQAIDQLPPGAARALRLFRFEGRGQAEIAAIMGISRSGVEKHLALAMRHLRESLSNCGLFDTVSSQKLKGLGGDTARRENVR